MTSGAAPCPFDELAADYDASFTDTRLGRWLRAAVWQRADRLFSGHGTILEIGCGTGRDACHLARRGHDVVATDASPAMLAVAEQEAARQGVADRIEFHCVAAEGLAAAFAGRTFDGVFSNFGALNCVADLDRLSATLGAQLAPGAPLLFVVMGRHAIWEWAWFLARLDVRTAFRRLGRNGADWRATRIRYPGRAVLERTLAPHFAGLSQRPLGIVLPPTYAARWLDDRPRVFAWLVRAERAAANLGLVAGADHLIVEGWRR